MILAFTVLTFFVPTLNCKLISHNTKEYLFKNIHVDNQAILSNSHNGACNFQKLMLCLVWTKKYNPGYIIYYFFRFVSLNVVQCIYSAVLLFLLVANGRTTHKYEWLHLWHLLF